MRQDRPRLITPIFTQNHRVQANLQAIGLDKSGLAW